MNESAYERLTSEKHELNLKIEKLKVFIKSDSFRDIGLAQMGLLSIQLKAMESYEQCLTARMINLGMHL